jgi:hypothetical protein
MKRIYIVGVSRFLERNEMPTIFFEIRKHQDVDEVLWQSYNFVHSVDCLVSRPKSSGVARQMVGRSWLAMDEWSPLQVKPLPMKLQVQGVKGLKL